jgi:hypothetical protein
MARSGSSGAVGGMKLRGAALAITGWGTPSSLGATGGSVYTSNVSSRVLLGIAATAVATLIIGLWAMSKPVSGDSIQTRTPVEAATRAPHDETPARSTAAPATPARKPSIATVAPPEPTGLRSSDGPSGAPAAPAQDPTEARVAQMRGLLKAQVVATEQQMIECMDKAGNGVAKLDGVVAFPLVVSRKDGKIVTESSGIDYVTVGNQAVVDCMAGVMKKMSYDELPEGVASVTGYRKITVKDGVLVEDWLGPHKAVDAMPR